MRSCRFCKKDVRSSTKRCPYCRKLQYDFYKEFTETERNLEIILKLKTGDYTLEDMAQNYNLSRERIRQIWKKHTGIGFAERRNKKRLLKEIEKQRFLSTIKFICKACNMPVTYREGGRKHFLCVRCNHILMVDKRDPYVKFDCDYCDIKYHPQRNHKHMPTKKHYCKIEHYRADRFRK